MGCHAVCGQVNHKNGNAFEGVYEAIELGTPSASAIKLVESMTLPADDPNRFDFEGVVGSLPADAPSPLHHALWAASMSLAAKYVGRVWGGLRGGSGGSGGGA